MIKMMIMMIMIMITMTLNDAGDVAAADEDHNDDISW